MNIVSGTNHHLAGDTLGLDALWETDLLICNLLSSLDSIYNPLSNIVQSTSVSRELRNSVDSDVLSGSNEIAMEVIKILINFYYGIC